MWRRLNREEAVAAKTPVALEVQVIRILPMKWLLLLLLLIGLGVFLVNTLDVERFGRLGSPSPGSVACPLVLVGIVFVIGLGVWKFLFRE